MKRFIIAALALLILLTCAAENRPQGNTRLMYRADSAETLPEGWQKTCYITDDGQMYLAFSDEAEITVSLERGWSFEGVCGMIERRARITYSGSDDSRIAIKYISLRDEGTEHVFIAYPYRWDEVTCVATLDTWGESAGETEKWFENAFVPSLEIREYNASDYYLAQLEGCEMADGVLTLTIDFVDIEYDSGSGSVMFMNSEDRGYTFRTKADALIYLPDITTAVYAQLDAGADERLINYTINEYRGIYGTDAVYLVQFDENNTIIRIQHYNAL